MAERKRNTSAGRKTAARSSRRAYSRTLKKVPCTIELCYSISVGSSDKETRKYIMEGELSDSTRELSVEYPGFPFLGLFYPDKCAVRIPKSNRNSVVITGLDERLVPLGLRTFVCEEGENIATYGLHGDSLVAAAGFPTDYSVKTEKLVNTVTMLGGRIDIDFNVDAPSIGKIAVEYHMTVTPHNGYHSYSEI
ncbi:MAG: hypothetical protein J5940_07130 [Clostridia bacterium]|nr:hypothetical protein [Clostridia bacterium]